MKRFLYGAGATVAAVALGAATSSAALSAPTDQFFNDMGATGEDAMAYLKDLSDISWEHEDTGFRSLGTPGFTAASEYVEGVMTDLGYDVERQEFEVTNQEFGTVELSVNGTAVENVGTLSYTEGTTEPITDAALVLPTDDAYGDGTGGELGCAATDFGPEVDGAIVLVQRGECAFADKVKFASEAGAQAVVIYNNVDGAVNGTLGERLEGTAPAASVDLATGQEIFDQIVGASEPATASLTLETEFVTVKTWNILAETTAGDPANVHMLGAHLDGVAEGPGVNDNASGVAGLLTVAKSLAAQERPVDNKVRFGFWGAEEVGLVGSTEYVASLSEEELSTIKSYLNYDMIGSNNYAIATLDSNGDYRDIPEGVTVPEGSVELESLFTDYFESMDQPYIGSEFSGRSDYLAFMENGIPVSGLDSGADEIKTEDEVALFGGEAGVQLDTNYHQITDTYENVDPTSVGIIVPAMANATYQLAYSEQSKAEDAAEAAQPTEEPSTQPTEAPSTQPTEEPSTQPTEAPEDGAPEDPAEDGAGTDENSGDTDGTGDSANAGGSDGSALPRTGVDTLPLVFGAGLLVTVGAAAVALTRRQR